MYKLIDIVTVNENPISGIKNRQYPENQTSNILRKEPIKIQYQSTSFF